MQILLRVIVFALFGALLGLSVAIFGISISNRYSAQEDANQLYAIQEETSVVIQNITLLQTSITIINHTINQYNLTEFAEVFEEVHNVTTNLYPAFIQLLENAIFSFNGNTTQPVYNNLMLIGAFGITVNNWNIDASILESELSMLQTQVNSLQTFVQVTLTTEIETINNNAIKTINTTQQPLFNELVFSSICNMSVVGSGGDTLTWKTCTGTPNAYNCNQQVAELTTLIENITQTQTYIYNQITNITNEIVYIQTTNINGTLKQITKTGVDPTFGPHAFFVNGSHTYVTTNSSGIYVFRDDQVIDSLGGTTAADINIISGTPGLTATVTAPNQVTITSGSVSSCYQVPDFNTYGVNFFTSDASSSPIGQWKPVIVNGYTFGSPLSCHSVFSNTCGFSRSGSYPFCSNNQGWNQLLTIFGGNPCYIFFQVPSDGHTWSIQLKIFAALAPGTTYQDSTAVTFALVETPVTTTECQGALVATFASSMNVFTTTGTLATNAYYYYGEITFSNQDTIWTPGNVYYLCQFWSGPGNLSPGADYFLFEPSLVKIN